MSAKENEPEEKNESQETKTQQTKTQQSKRPRGRPPVDQPLEQHSVSMTSDLWQWAISQPEGARGLFRMLLERERNRRSSAFFSQAESYQQIAEIMTPFGNLSVVEIPGHGVLLMRYDERNRYLAYTSDADGWHVGFGEDDLSEVSSVKSRHQDMIYNPPRKPAKRRKPQKIKD